MMTTTPHPPTNLHESTPLTPSSAEPFLSAFLADAGQKPNQNEIVLTNLLRVQRALAGVYVPPSPPPSAAMVAAEAGILTKGEARVGEVAGEGAGGGEYGEERVDSDKEKGGDEIVPGIATAEVGGMDRESRKERKARKRRREEKAKEKERKRARKEKGEEERKRARKEKGEKGDGSE
ncbi:hypothetical protein B9Z19DRAFT_1108517 [Tuber borchii]|uniref:Uncharacterized protein n=1 Tax=Tuber borchii TaxID=42251 RepID=A0A2T6ZRD8_TUBBO|nr:hypothetical protein B9Z19DRAFT_1108517 [Tuber borchii]